MWECPYRVIRSWRSLLDERWNVSKKQVQLPKIQPLELPWPGWLRTISILLQIYNWLRCLHTSTHYQIIILLLSPERETPELLHYLIRVTLSSSLDLFLYIQLTFYRQKWKPSRVPSSSWSSASAVVSLLCTLAWFLFLFLFIFFLPLYGSKAFFFSQATITDYLKSDINPSQCHINQNQQVLHAKYINCYSLPKQLYDFHKWAQVSIAIVAAIFLVSTVRNIPNKKMCLKSGSLFSIMVNV